MTKKSKVPNENYRHCCNEPFISLKKHQESITNPNVNIFTEEELKIIFDFYVSKSPTKKDGKESGHNRWLGEYGWKDASGLRKLEGLLLASSGISSFYLMKSDSIDSTLESMKLGEEICPKHPRCVALISKNVLVEEDGNVKINPTEKRLVCLFRHTRNALAHGLTYILPNGYLLLEDVNEQKITFRMLIRHQTLIDWIRIIDNNGMFYRFKDDDRD